MEKKEAIARYEIEKQYLKSKNKVLNQIKKQTKEKAQLLSTISKDYEVSEKKAKYRTKAELYQSIEEQKQLCQEKEVILEKATKQFMLQSLFPFTCTKAFPFLETISFSLFGGLGSMLIMTCPTLLDPFGNLYAKLVTIALSSIGGCLVFGASQVKKHHDNKKLFNKLNQELGADAIELKKSKTPKNKLSLKQTISDLYESRYQLEIDQKEYEMKQKESQIIGDEKTTQPQFSHPVSLHIPTEQRAKILRKQYRK